MIKTLRRPARPEATILARFTIEQDWRGASVVDRAWDERVATFDDTGEAAEHIVTLEREALALGDGITVEGLPLVTDA